MNAVILVAVVTGFLGLLLALYGIVAALDRVPAIHERLAEWDETPWGDQ